MRLVNNRSIALLLFFVAFSTGIFGQYSRTYDLYQYSREVGQDIIKIENNMYVAASGVLENPVRYSTDLVNFNETGEIVWTRKLDWMAPALESLVYVNEEIYVAGVGNTQPLEFTIYKTNTDNDSLGVIVIENESLQLVDVLSLKDTGSALVMNGSCRRNEDDSQNAFIAWINYDLTIDTFIVNSNLGQSTYLESQIDQDGNTYVLLIGTQDNPNNNGLLYFRGIVKYDDNKNENILFKTALEYDYNPGGVSLDIFPNGNFVFVNQNGEYFMAPKIQCFSPAGDLLWEYIYEYQLNQHTLMDLKILEDESILICGGYASLVDDIFSTGFTMKLSSDGDLIWSRYYTTGRYSENAHESLAGKEKYSNFRGFIEQTDSIYLTGSVTNLDFDEEYYFHSDIWLLKVDKDGCYIPDCLSWQNVSSTNELLLSENENISLYPVPTSDVLNIKHIGNQLYQTIIIYNLQGQPIYTIIGSTDQIDVSMLPTGIYVARFYDRDHRTMAVKKFSKV